MDNRKKKLVIVSSLVSFGVLLITTSVIVGDQLVIDYRASPAYEMALSKDNKPILSNGKGSLLVKGTDFSYEGAKDSSNGHVVLSSGGYVKNYSIGEDWNAICNMSSFKVTFSRISDVGFLRYKLSDKEIDAPAIMGNNLESGVAVAVTGSESENTFFSIYASNGDFEIQNIEIAYGCGTYAPKSLSEERKISLLGVNDFHGKVDEKSYFVGMKKLTTGFKNKIKEKGDENSIIFSSGDMWAGASTSGLTKGNIVNAWMNDVGFDYMVLGNHEFDWGKNVILNNVQTADFPYLACNVFSDSSFTTPMVETSLLLKRNGLNIGIIGSNGNSNSSVLKSAKEGCYFKTYSNMTSLVTKESDKLRELGADIIVYDIHGGPTSTGSYDSIYSMVLSGKSMKYPESRYVDVVLEGHTHQEYVNKDESGVYHVQGGSDGQNITEVNITFNTSTKAISVEAPINNSTKTFTSLSEDQDDEIIYDHFVSKIAAKRDEIVCRLETTMNSTQIKDLTARCYYQEFYELAKKEGYDIVLGGGGINIRSPYNLYGGERTYGDVYDVLCFNNDLAVCSIPGSILKSNFINNSSYVVYPNNLVSSDYSDNEEYYVILDSWSFEYSANKATVIKRFLPSNSEDTLYSRDIVADSLRRNSSAHDVKVTLSLSQTLPVGYSVFFKGDATSWVAKEMSLSSGVASLTLRSLHTSQRENYQIYVGTSEDNLFACNEVKNNANGQLGYVTPGSNTLSLGSFTFSSI